MSCALIIPTTALRESSDRPETLFLVVMRCRHSDGSQHVRRPPGSTEIDPDRNDNVAVDLFRNLLDPGSSLRINNRRTGSQR